MLWPIWQRSVLPETPLEGARRVADTLRREFADMPIQWKDEALTITTSFGVTSSLPSEMDSDAIIGRADAALYLAKDRGRNCVRVAVESVLASFETREDYLEDIPVADTVLVLQALAAKE